MNWPLIRLAELGAISTGSTPSTTESRFYGGDIPFVTPSELNTGVPITTTPRTLTDEGAAVARVLPEGSVMVCCIGSLGKIGIAGRSVATNQQINSVVFNRERVWPGYGFYACRLLKPKLDCMAPATTLPIVSKSKFAELTIPVPPLSEQRRIAAVLDQAEALRAKRRAALAELDSLTQSIFLDLFGDPVSNPKGWPMKQVDDICETRLGKMLDQKQQTRLYLRPYLRNANVQWFRFDLAELFEMDFDEKARKSFCLKDGDLLICEGGEPGRAAVWRGELKECYYQKALHRVRPRGGSVIPDFLVWLFWFLAHQGGLDDHVTSATIAHLTGEKLNGMKIFLPPITLQREFARRVAAVEWLKTAHRASLAELDALFASLQHRAFRGEL